MSCCCCCFCCCSASRAEAPRKSPPGTPDAASVEGAVAAPLSTASLGAPCSDAPEPVCAACRAWGGAPGLSSGGGGAAAATEACGSTELLDSAAPLEWPTLPNPGASPLLEAAAAVVGGCSGGVGDTLRAPAASPLAPDASATLSEDASDSAPAISPPPLLAAPSATEPGGGGSGGAPWWWLAAAAATPTLLQGRAAADADGDGDANTGGAAARDPAARPAAAGP